MSITKRFSLLFSWVLILAALSPKAVWLTCDITEIARARR